MANKTFVPASIGVGSADFNGRKMGVLRLVDANPDGGTYDVVMTPAVLGELVASCDELRSQIRRA